MQTVVVGLRKSLKNQRMAAKISDIVDNMAEVKFHATNILALYANKVCMQKTKREALRHIEIMYQDSEEVFNQNIINAALKNTVSRLASFSYSTDCERIWFKFSPTF